VEHIESAMVPAPLLVDTFVLNPGPVPRGRVQTIRKIVSASSRSPQEQSRASNQRNIECVNRRETSAPQFVQQSARHVCDAVNRVLTHS